MNVQIFSMAYSLLALKEIYYVFRMSSWENDSVNVKKNYIQMYYLHSTSR